MSLFDPQPSFLKHDTFLYALLGLASLDKKLETLLSLDEIDIAAFANLDKGAGSADIDEFMLAALGLVSINGKLRSILLEWTEGESLFASESFTGTFGFEELDELLR